MRLGWLQKGARLSQELYVVINYCVPFFMSGFISRTSTSSYDNIALVGFSVTCMFFLWECNCVPFLCVDSKVGETGCGKTALVQRLAQGTGRELVVQNLSLQTDGADLLGGFRPVELRQLAQVT